MKKWTPIIIATIVVVIIGVVVGVMLSGSSDDSPATPTTGTTATATTPSTTNVTPTIETTGTTDTTAVVDETTAATGTSASTVETATATGPLSATELVGTDSVIGSVSVVQEASIGKEQYPDCMAAVVGAFDKESPMAEITVPSGYSSFDAKLGYESTARSGAASTVSLYEGSVSPSNRLYRGSFRGGGQPVTLPTVDVAQTTKLIFVATGNQEFSGEFLICEPTFS